MSGTGRRDLLQNQGLSTRGATYHADRTAGESGSSSTLVRGSNYAFDIENLGPYWDLLTPESCLQPNRSKSISQELSSFMLLEFRQPN